MNQHPGMVQNQPIGILPSTNATTALILSIIGLVGAFFYGLGLFFSIPSVVMANKAKQITNQIQDTLIQEWQPLQSLLDGLVLSLVDSLFMVIGFIFLLFLHSILVSKFPVFTRKFCRNIKYPRQSTAVTCWPEVLDGGGPEVDVSN